jgi:drug/metabolite transporter (DMT)-like permease
VFPLKVFVTLLLMGSIPMWIRLVDASSFVIGIVRLSFGLGLTLLFLHRRIEFKRALSEAGANGGLAPRFILLAIGLLFGAHWYTYFESIQRSSATLGILALSTYGIHVTWLGAVFSDRRPTARDWIAVALSALGAWVCLPTPETDAGAFWGFLLGMLSGLFYAALPLLHQKAASLSLSTRGAAQFSFAWLLFVPFAPFQDWSLDTQSWIVLAILGVACTFVAHNLWISITTQVRPATSGLLYYLAIPITMLLETLILDRAPSTMQLIGAALIIAGGGSVLVARRSANPA